MNEQKLEKIIEKGCEINDVSEAVFRERIVSKLLEALGYDLDKDVEYEVERSIGSNNSIKMDYVINSGKEYFVLDAKAPGKSMEDSYDQIISYIRVSRINYGILYNGKKLLVFHKESDDPIYMWICGYSNEIFESLKKVNFPTLLETLLSKEANRTKLKTYLDKNSESIESSVIKKISEDTGLSYDYVSGNVQVNTELSPLTELVIPSEGEVIVCPTYTNDPCGGVNFIEKTGGYGFVRLGPGRSPKYLAIYEINSKAITHVYKVKAVKRGDEKISQKWKDCKELLIGEKEYLDGKKVFFELEDEIPNFKPVPAVPRTYIRGIRYVKTLKALLNATTTKDFWP